MDVNRLKVIHAGCGRVRTLSGCEDLPCWAEFSVRRPTDGGGWMDELNGSI